MNMEKIFTQGLLNTYKLTVPENELNLTIVAELGRIARKVKIPGFRPGKVPFDIVSQRYHTEALEHVVNRFISNALSAIREELKHIVFEPEISINSFEESKDFVCTITVHAAPSFNPDVIDELPFERLTLEYPEGYFDSLTAFIQKLFCSMVPLESPRPAKQGDVVQIAMRVGEDAQEEHVVSFILEKIAALSESDLNLFIGKKVGDSLDLLESDVFHAGQWAIYAPRHSSKANQNVWNKMEDIVQAHKKYRDEQKTLLAKESEDSEQAKDEGLKQLAEKKAELPSVSFVVKDIGTLSEPPSSEEINAFCECIKVESFDAFIEGIKEKSTQHLSSAMELYNSRRLMDLLNEYFVFDVPSPLVEQEFESIWSFFKAEYKKAEESGDLSEEDKEKSEEDFRKEYMSIAERRVRLGYLMRTLSAKHNISLSRSEMYAIITNLLNLAQISEERFEKIVQQDKEILNKVLMPHLEKKIMGFILQRSVKTERSILPEVLIEESLEMIPFSPDAEEELNAIMEGLALVVLNICVFDAQHKERVYQLESGKEERQEQPALSSDTNQEGTI